VSAGQDTIVREAVGRCIAIIREQQQVFLSPRYATGQPLSSISERLACSLCIREIERAFGMEECQ